MMPDSPKDLRGLDHIDLELLALLEVDGRMPNNALAERVGIAPSTCLTRIRRLRELGAIRGFHADVDPAWIGRPIQAMIAVRIRSDARDAIGKFAESLAGRIFGVSLASRIIFCPIARNLHIVSP